MSLRSEVLAYINPMFFFYATIYAVSRVYQAIINTESIWQLSWDKAIDIFGEDPRTYSIWVLNSFSYLVYWIFGLALIVMELIRMPKSLKDYKIQQESDELKKTEKLPNVINELI